MKHEELLVYLSPSSVLQNKVKVSFLNYRVLMGHCSICTITAYGDLSSVQRCVGFCYVNTEQSLP